MIEDTEPSLIESTTIFCLLISLLSMIKSLSAVGSAILYPKVFLDRDELLKSKVWSKDLFSSNVFDLYSSPIKYGNVGSPVVGFTVA